MFMEQVTSREQFGRIFEDCCIKGKIGLLKKYLQNYLQYCDFVDPDGNTLLHIYIDNTINLDFEEDASDSESDTENDGFKKKKFKVTDQLIERCSFSQVNSQGNNVFMLACLKEEDRLAMKILRKGGFNLDQVNVNGDTSLTLACYYGHDDWEDDLDMVSLILSSGFTNFNAVDESGNNALICSIDQCSRTTISTLVNTNGFNLAQVNNDKETALILICSEGYVTIADDILSKGDCSEEVVDLTGKTALIHACRKDLDAIAKKLISNGKCPVAQVDNMGNTALIFACYNNMEETALLLLETECKVEQVNKLGHDALYYAKQRGLDKVVSAIESGYEPADEGVVGSVKI